MPLVTNIQKYSIHDGDGIRTSVFFKGCPLRCSWCHNPETQNHRQQMLTNLEKCTGCGICAQVCPQNAVSIKDGKAITDNERCNGCGTCTIHCLQNIREIAGRKYTIKELVKELMKDEAFYEESGGGVTLSGGEVMCMDMDYVEALARELTRKGVSIFVDTCGHASYENFERLLPHVDTFLYDIKAIDTDVHKKYVGADNDLILENLEKLSKAGARIYIRIPTIKGVNSDKDSMLRIIRWLKDHEISIPQVNLLPYHDTGSSKYGRLGEQYKGDDFETPSREEMEEYARLFQQEGFLNTKIGG